MPLLAATLLVACASAPAPEDARVPRIVDACAQPGWLARQVDTLRGHTPVRVEGNNVRFLEAGLDQAVTVRALDAAPIAAGELMVTVQFLNCTDQRIVLGARTSFLDSRRLPVGAASAWQRIHLAPRATALYVERTLDGEGATKFFVEVRNDGRSQ
jgi:hypothetical protein